MPIPDRQKQRREYLRKKAGISRLFIAYSYASMLLLFTGGAFILLAYFSLHKVFVSHKALFLLPAVVSGSVAFGCCRAFAYISQCIQQTQREEARLPVVPPVTANTLPAEEILVRSSQEPEQEQSTLLLRAAESTKTSAEELLRASTASSQE